MGGIDQQQIHRFGQVGHLHVAVGVDRLNVPILKETCGVDIRTLQFNVIPGMVVEKHDLHVFVRRIDRIHRADQHHRRIGIIVDLIHLAQDRK